MQIIWEWGGLKQITNQQTTEPTSNLKGDSLYIYLGVHVYKIPFRQLSYHAGAWYIDVLWLKNFAIRLKTDSGAIVLQNENG